MLTNIFEHFVPISWAPGHMGTFLQNFLTQETSYPIPLSRPYGIGDNKEWFFLDPFDNFFGSPRGAYNDVYNSLSNTYSGLELTKQAALEVLKRKYQTLSSDELTFDVIKNNSSRYIKEHTNNSHQGPGCVIAQIKWKNKKIKCRFPLEYSWIPYFLLKYKFERSDRESKQKDMVKLDSMYNNHASTLFYKMDEWIQNTNDTNEYFEFDIYNLVINKNLDQVYEIDPNFKFNDTKQQMLDLANKTTLEILEHFNLDPTWQIDKTTTVKEVLEKAKIN